MKKTNLNIEQLISRKISGEITNSETEQLFKWISESEENATLYKSLIFALSEKIKQGSKDSVWEKIENKFSEQNIKANPPLILNKLLRVAAILIFILLLPIAVNKIFKKDADYGFIHVVKGNDITTNFYLPDGTKVILARGSEISYNDNYNHNNRDLTLKGKTYIEINATKNKFPIVVTSEGRCAIAQEGKLVLNGNSDCLDVAVEEGLVTLIDTAYKRVVIPLVKLKPSTKSKENTLLKKIKENNQVSAGQEVTYKAMNELSINNNPDQCEKFGWKDRVFCFSDLNYYELADKISIWFGKNIEFKGEINHGILYSGSYDNPKVDELIQEIFGNNVKEIKITRNKIIVIFS